MTLSWLAAERRQPREVVERDAHRGGVEPGRRLEQLGVDSSTVPVANWRATASEVTREAMREKHRAFTSRRERGEERVEGVHLLDTRRHLCLPLPEGFQEEQRRRSTGYSPDPLL